MVEGFLACATREFRGIQRLGNAALAQLRDEQWFVDPYSDGNCVGVIVKHLSGNMRSRWRDFLTADGEKQDRDRDSEFVISAADTSATLRTGWEEGWEYLFRALDALTEADLGRPVRIRGEEHTVLQAIQRQLTHYAYHVGQIVFCARGLVGPEWKTLSVARNRSRDLLTAPKPYLHPGPPGDRASG
jgi:hypothetical protein